ncbi:hypothetical protein DSM112329_02435 [Paraconexibacter sp. AEG42_29]|uniref:Glycosyltransferase 2-like domain-containing protein n=1 Tax=Paraconexibacter sp. AEG42_29 TaxID=2997339 RepID=A0AAU7AVU1_9ACTN
MTDVSVVICTHTFERWTDLLASVASVRAQRVPAREVIVVVDGNAELLERAQANVVGAQVVLNRHPRGISGARVTGAEHVTAEVVAFLDDDAIAEPGWIAGLLDVYRDPAVIGAGGWVTPLWRKPPPKWFPDEFNWVVGCSYTGMDVTGGRIRNPIGANMSVRADVLWRAGGFAPELGRVEVGGVVSGTADETEFCIRAARLHPGGYWAFAPAATVHHAVTPARSTPRYFVRRCRQEGTAKALLSRLTGTEDGLASERHYTRSVLPRAVVRELRAAARGTPGAAGRAVAIGVGFSVTAGAYAHARIRLGRR